MAYKKTSSGMEKRRAAHAAYQRALKKPLGEGSRFKAMVNSIMLNVKPRPGQTKEQAAEGIAAWRGRQKLGKKKFQMLAAKGRKK